MKILITGVTGFVAKHFLRLLNDVEPGSTVIGLARHTTDFDKTSFPALNIFLEELDLLDRPRVAGVLKEYRPEYILHLASVSSVGLSWQQPVESFVNNTNIFLNLVEEIRITAIPCRILSVGSSEEYGDVPASELPLTEAHRLTPVSPYAVARVSQEMLSMIYAHGYKQDIVMSRSFNHIGPGQTDRFVVSSFAKQMVRIAAEKNGRGKLVTGDLEIIRDFLDVRDVVKAYYLLLKNGKAGDVYNICSGKSTRLREIIDLMGNILGIQPDIEINPAFIRPNENKIVTGSSEKIFNELGWTPTLTLNDSLNDLIGFWKTQYLS